MAGTVCMYPLIPIVTSVISGRQATTLWRGFGLSFAYVGPSVDLRGSGNARSTGRHSAGGTHAAALGACDVRLASDLDGAWYVRSVSPAVADPVAKPCRDLEQSASRRPGRTGIRDGRTLGADCRPVLDTGPGGRVAVHRKQPGYRRRRTGAVCDGYRHRPAAAGRGDLRRARAAEVGALDARGAQWKPASCCSLPPCGSFIR